MTTYTYPERIGPWRVIDVQRSWGPELVTATVDVDGEVLTATLVEADYDNGPDISERWIVGKVHPDALDGDGRPRLMTPMVKMFDGPVHRLIVGPERTTWQHSQHDSALDADARMVHTIY